MKPKKDAGRDRFLALFQCPACGNECLRGDAAELQVSCAGCGRVFTRQEGVLDFVGDAPRAVSLSQRFMESAPVAAVYEKYSRPFATRLVSNLAWELKTAAGLLELKPGATLLDLACGPGNFTRALAPGVVPGLTIGLDLSRPMLDEAARQNTNPQTSGIYYVRADVTRWPLRPQVCDRIHSAGALHLFPKLKQVLASIHNALKPGGLFVCGTYLKDRGILRGWNPLIENLSGIHWFSLAELRSLLESAGFSDWLAKTYRSAVIFRVRRAV